MATATTLSDDALAAITHWLNALRQENGGSIHKNPAVNQVEENTQYDRSTIIDAVESTKVTVQDGKLQEEIVDVVTVGEQPDSLEQADIDYGANAATDAPGTAGGAGFNPADHMDIAGDNDGDDLEQLTHIGTKLEAVLKDEGYETFKDIHQADVDDLKQIPKINTTIADTIKTESGEYLDGVMETAQRTLERTQDFYDSDDTTGATSKVHQAQDVDEPAAEPYGPGNTPGNKPWHLFGLPVLEDVGHPLCEPVEDFQPLKTREVRTGEKDIELVSRLLAKNNYAVNLVGHAGVGKDTLLKYIFAYCNRPFITINMDGSMVSQDILGIHKIDDDGKVIWEDGIIPRAYQNGWGVIADEVNAAPPKILMALHQMLERDGGLFLREAGKMIEPHPEFRFTSTMNPPTKGYSGTNELNDAFKGRLISIRLGYLAFEKEVDLVDYLANNDRRVVDRNDVKRLVNAAQFFRAEADTRNYPRVSTRDLIQTVEVADGSNNLEGAFQEIVAGLVGPDNRQRESIIEMAADKLQLPA